jgi:hypothetical protein
MCDVIHFVPLCRSPIKFIVFMAGRALADVAWLVSFAIMSCTGAGKFQLGIWFG